MRVDTDNIQIRDEGDILSITLPPSQYSRTVTVTKGPRNPNLENKSSASFLPRPDTSATSTSSSISSLPDTQSTGDFFAVGGIDVGGHHGPAAGSGTIIPSSPAIDPSAINHALDALDLCSQSSGGGSEEPSHSRQRPIHDQFRVSNDVLKRYPPFHKGWKKRCWVVVIRGRDIGVFYDFWARIWPLIKYNDESIIAGASWKKAESKQDAFNKWELAVEAGATDYIF